MLGRGLSITTRLSLHKNELDVVLDNRVRLVRLAEKRGAVANLIIRIGDLVPDDGIEIVETELTTDNTNICMKWKNQVTSKGLARNTDIPNHTNQPSPGHKNSQSVFPYLFKLF